MYGPCLSSIDGDQALTSPRRHCLGRPLPYQLADTEQANPKAINLYPGTNFTIVSNFSIKYCEKNKSCYQTKHYYVKLVLGFTVRTKRPFQSWCSGPSSITLSFDKLFLTFGFVPILYYLVCRLPCGPLDLHALSTPPAFILS